MIYGKIREGNKSSVHPQNVPQLRGVSEDPLDYVLYLRCAYKPDRRCTRGLGGCYISHQQGPHGTITTHIHGIYTIPYVE
jgi:hypothetical protein